MVRTFLPVLVIGALLHVLVLAGTEQVLAKSPTAQPTNLALQMQKQRDVDGNKIGSATPTTPTSFEAYVTEQLEAQRKRLIQEMRAMANSTAASAETTADKLKTAWPGCLVRLKKRTKDNPGRDWNLGMVFIHPWTKRGYLKGHVAIQALGQSKAFIRYDDTQASPGMRDWIEIPLSDVVDVYYPEKNLWGEYLLLFMQGK